MTALLEARGLVRRFGGVAAVGGVDLAVAAGELLAVIGPNGAGKTTLFDLLSGHARPDAGTITFAGQDVTGASPERLAAQGLARTFQHGRVWGNLTVLDNVLVGAHVRLRAVRPPVPVLGPVLELGLALLRPPSVRAEERSLRAEALEILRIFGDRLLPRVNDPAHTLSYANRRRVEIARALMLRPRLLLLDEPAAGMNPFETNEIEAVIGKLRAQGLAILLVEHKLDMVLRLADRVLVMDHGTGLAEGRPEVVRHDPQVIEAYIGRRHGGAFAPAG